MKPEATSALRRIAPPARSQPPLSPPTPAAQRSLKSDADVDVRFTMDIIDTQLSSVEVLRDALGSRNGLSPAEREAEARDAERTAEEEAITQAEQVKCSRQTSPLPLRPYCQCAQ